MTHESMTHPLSIAQGLHLFLDETMNGATVVEPPALLRRLREHLGADPATLKVIEESFDRTEHPNIQIALDELLTEQGRSSELLGINASGMRWQGFSLNDIATSFVGRWSNAEVDSGPVAYRNVYLPDGRSLQCVRFGLYLITSGDERVGLAISCPRGEGVVVAAISSNPEHATGLLKLLRTRAHVQNIYRGHVLTISSDEYGCYGLQFHSIPPVARDQLILPERTLAQAERHTIGFSMRRDAMLAAGHHLRRGLLLYGPPGTGKTLTGMYLAGQMSGRTTLLLSGHGIGQLDRACALARKLQPSMLVIEDVDLIAQERTRSSGLKGFLYQLLNEMDGFARDDDVIFLLTTNRADLLEPALAARPGRIDQAIEVPLPDADCRQRLFDLYRRNAKLDIEDFSHYVARTAGVSAAFIREALRKAALYAAEDGDASHITASHLDAALDDLLIVGGPLLSSLLGARIGFDQAA